MGYGDFANEMIMVENAIDESMKSPEYFGIFKSTFTYDNHVEYFIASSLDIRNLFAAIHIFSFGSKVNYEYEKRLCEKIFSRRDF